GRFRPWQAYVSTGIDGLVLSGFAYSLGAQGYIVLPLVIFVVAGSALGMPGPGLVQYTTCVLGYPVARLLGTAAVGAPIPVSLLLIETFFIAGPGFVARIAPGSFVKRLRALRARLVEVESGDLSVRLPHAHLDDIGFLAVSVNRTLEALGGMINEVQEHARSLAAMADQLAATAEQVSTTSEKVAQETSELARHVEEQYGAAQQGRGLADALAHMSLELSGRAAASAGEVGRLSSELSSQAARAGRAGEALSELGQHAHDAAQSARGLSAAGEQIGGSARHIHDLAQRTNFLALNAAIEAARAGGEGSGFAVVADEVRKLAGQSGGAAAEVQRAVTGARDGIEQVHEALAQLESRLGGVGEVTAESRDALAAMVAGVEHVVDSFTTIASGVQEQAARLESLAGNAEALQQFATEARSRASGIVQGGAEQIASMQELAGASEHLAELAARLDSLTNRFRTIRPDASAPEDVSAGRHKLATTLRATLTAGA
ncbi:MAG TPA: methyl-accepting chemotaxis protein, partial [Longimicrobiales bacterium]